MKFNSLMQELPDDAPTFTEAMGNVTAEEFGVRIAKCFHENRSSNAIHFIQQAFLDCEDDNGIYWEAFDKMLTRLTGIEAATEGE